MQALDNRQSVRCLYVDFRKAFDRVDHTTALRKMAELNIDDIFLRWMRSYLSDRRQRVKVGNTVSPWLRPNGGMPQGSYFGPYVFLIMINDLTTNVPLIKFVDDVTAVEIVNPGACSHMQTALDQISRWSDANFMEINTKKSKQMFFGIASSANQQSPLVSGNDTIDTVTSFKLLGVNISSDLRWDEHIDIICAKASKRLHYLSLLKRSSVRHAELLLYYKTIVRPIIEYACPVWQSGLTEEHRQRLEAIQRRAFRIISGSTDYELQCVINDIEPVSVRLQNLTRSFFDRINEEHDCLHWLLPPRRPTYIDRLKTCNKLPLIKCRTQRFKMSFLPYALDNFQI
jgi:ribonucleases P/MRP protein subunit RPP40